MQTQVEHQRDGWRRTLELPADIREPLTELARVNERTTAAEIRHALRKHLERAEHEAAG